MRALGWFALGAALAVPIPAVAAKTADTMKSQPVIESSRPGDIRPLNEKIAAAHKESEPWVKDPLQIVLHLEEQGPDAVDERKHLTLQFEGGPGEHPNTATITLLTEGYLDDSVRGEWVQYDMTRGGDGVWSVTQVRRAWRCQRGKNTMNYSQEKCP